MTRPSLMLRLAPGLLTSALLIAGFMSNAQSAAASTPKASDMLVFVCSDEAGASLSEAEAQYMMNPAEAIKDLVYIFDRSTGIGYEWNETENAMVPYRPINFGQTIYVHTPRLSKDRKKIILEGIEYNYSSGDMMITSEYTETISLK